MICLMLYNGCNYFSWLGFESIHASKRGPGSDSGHTKFIAMYVCKNIIMNMYSAIPKFTLGKKQHLMD